MATPDMDVIKDIPGYKVILKAVLRAQIQNLVEQLAATTDEESVILTASVSDGTLSHLGSDSGKFFLEDHEDIKSSFLGFCLKRHHILKQQEKEKKEKEAAAAAAMRSQPPFFNQGMSPRGGYGRFPRMSYPRMSTPRGQGPGMRMPSMNRFEPYPGNRMPRKNSIDPSGDSVGGQEAQATVSQQIVKSEPTDSGDNAGTDSPSHPGGDDERSNSSSSTIPNDASDKPSGDNNQSDNVQDSDATTSNSGALDSNVNIKVEAISEADMELEITGVEPGNGNINQSQDGGENWGQNMSGLDLGFDQSGGAIGSPLDLQGAEQGYSGSDDTTQPNITPVHTVLESVNQVTDCTAVLSTANSTNVNADVHSTYAALDASAKNVSVNSTTPGASVTQTSTSGACDALMSGSEPPTMQHDRHKTVSKSTPANIGQLKMGSHMPSKNSFEPTVETKKDSDIGKNDSFRQNESQFSKDTLINEPDSIATKIGAPAEETQERNAQQSLHQDRKSRDYQPNVCKEQGCKNEKTEMDIDELQVREDTIAKDTVSFKSSNSVSSSERDFGDKPKKVVDICAVNDKVKDDLSTPEVKTDISTVSTDKMTSVNTTIEKTSLSEQENHLSKCQESTSLLNSKAQQKQVISKPVQNQASSDQESNNELANMSEDETDTYLESEDLLYYKEFPEIGDTEEDMIIVNECFDLLRELTDKVDENITKERKQAVQTKTTTKPSTSSSTKPKPSLSLLTASTSKGNSTIALTLAAKKSVDQHTDKLADIKSKNATTNDKDDGSDVNDSCNSESHETEIKEEPVTPTDETAEKAYQVLAIWSKIAEASGDASSDVLYDLITQKLKDDKSKETRAIATELISTLEGVKRQERGVSSDSFTDNESVKGPDELSNDKTANFNKVTEADECRRTSESRSESESNVDLPTSKTGETSESDDHTKSKVASETCGRGRSEDCGKKVVSTPGTINPPKSKSDTDSVVKIVIPDSPSKSKPGSQVNTSASENNINMPNVQHNMPEVIVLDSQPVCPGQKTPSKEPNIGASLPHKQQTPQRPITTGVVQQQQQQQQPRRTQMSPGPQKAGLANRGRPPTASPQRQQASNTQAVTPQKKSFIENLIATGIPIVIPDDDDNSSSSTGRPVPSIAKSPGHQQPVLMPGRRDHLQTTPLKNSGNIRPRINSPPGFRQAPLLQYQNPTFVPQRPVVALQQHPPGFMYDDPPLQTTPKKNMVLPTSPGTPPRFGSPLTPTGQSRIAMYPQTPPARRSEFPNFRHMVTNIPPERRLMTSFPSAGQEFSQAVPSPINTNQQLHSPINVKPQQQSPRPGQLTEARRRSRQLQQSASAQKLKDFAGPTIIIDEDSGSCLPKGNVPPQQAPVPHSPPVAQVECLPIISNVTSMAVPAPKAPQASETAEGVLNPLDAFETSTEPPVKKTPKRSRSDDMVQTSVEYMEEPEAKRQATGLIGESSISSTQSQPFEQQTILPSETLASLESLSAMCQNIQDSQAESARKSAACPEVFIDIDLDENKHALLHNLNLSPSPPPPAEKTIETPAAVTQVAASSTSDVDVTSHQEAKRRGDKALAHKPKASKEHDDDSDGSLGTKGKRKGKELSCDDCDEKFSTKTALKVHQKKHNKTNKPFECDVCGKRFAQKATLKKHIYTHFQEQDK